MTPRDISRLYNILKKEKKYDLTITIGNDTVLSMSKVNLKQNLRKEKEKEKVGKIGFRVWYAMYIINLVPRFFIKFIVLNIRLMIRMEELFI